MKLSKTTKDILKNYSVINNAIVIPPGNIISTMRAGMHVLAHAEVEEEFPYEISMHDVSKFNALVNSFDEPELDFQEKFVTIDGGNLGSIRFMYHPKNTLERECATTAKGKTIFAYQAKPKLPEPVIDTYITDEVFKRLKSSADILGLPLITFKSIGGKLFVLANQRNNISDNTFKYELCETDKTVDVAIKRDNVHFLPADYSIAIHDRCVVFTTEDEKLMYMITAEVE